MLRAASASARPAASPAKRRKRSFSKPSAAVPSTSSATLTARIKKTEIPDNKVFFGPEHWQPDFLTNRKNVIPETDTAPCKTNCPAHIAVQG